MGEMIQRGVQKMEYGENKCACKWLNKFTLMVKDREFGSLEEEDEYKDTADR